MPPLAALLEERVAWAHARAGELRHTERALSAVEADYERRRAADDPEWVYWLDEDEITFKTVDGRLIYVQFLGLGELTPRIMDILDGDMPTHFGEQYIFVTPRMETGDPRYSWVNQTVFIGEGRVLPGPRIEFRVYRVANS